MNIGQAAERSGVSAKMIRYYEQTGLLTPAERTASGYRTYGQRDVEILRFIRHARDLGFSITAIADLLALWADKGRHSSDVKRLALDHLAALRERIATLESVASALQVLADSCCGDTRPDCPILTGLEEGQGRHDSIRLDAAPQHGPR